VQGVAGALVDQQARAADGRGQGKASAPSRLELRRWRLIIDSMEVAVPIPQFRGVPLVYRQYRFVVGVQLGD
jgi:hypothetical protein